MDAESPPDLELLAYNVRCIRMAHNQTQAELAVAAGVDKATIHRIERGKRVHRRTMQKVALVLGGSVEFLNSVLPYGMPESERKRFVHRKEDLTWYTMGDRRKRIPEDSQERIQSLKERRRLGRQGLVASFQAYTFAMPKGPGMSVSEVFGVSYVGPNETYEDCIVFCARGELLFRSGEESIVLREGDGIGFGADETATVEPAHPVEGEPPIMWFITANRRGHVPIPFNGAARSRTRHQRSKV